MPDYRDTCMVQNDPSLLNAKRRHKIEIRPFLFAFHPIRYGFLFMHSGLPLDLKSLLLISLCLERKLIKGRLSKENSSRDRKIIHRNLLYMD